jgi:peptidase M48-like protein
MRTKFFPSVVFIVLAMSLAYAQSPQLSLAQPGAVPLPTDRPHSQPPSAPQDLNQVIFNRVVAREHLMMETLQHLQPLMETYLQNMAPDQELGYVPSHDEYFLGRLDLGHIRADEKLYVDEPSMWKKVLRTMNPTMPMTYVPRGFASALLIDGEHFDLDHYIFNYVRQDFLGDVRCLVFDITPKKGSGTNAFHGRIWVEDKDYNIVRAKGVHQGSAFHYEYHSDVWRQNLRPGLWLPTYVYSEESDMKYGVVRKLRFKAETRLWGYDRKFSTPQEELTRVIVDDPNKTKDHSETAQDLTPVQSQREWEHEAEENVIERLEKAGLLAPKGEVDKVLDTVVTNLEITNNLDIQPEVNCRVLLTTPLESFTIGHTIVVSRGFLDVLPDETSLAMVMSHELAHIVLGHRLDTKYSFNDRLQFPDEKTFHSIGLGANEHDEEAADAKAIALLQNSPYKDKLGTAGLFLRALDLRAHGLPNLLTPRLGSPVTNGKGMRMSALESSAPPLLMNRVDQVAALPLGGRIRVNAWSNELELHRTPNVPVLSAREKMPFEVTPLIPYIRRLPEGDNSPKSSTTTPDATVAGANGTPQ